MLPFMPSNSLTSTIHIELTDEAKQYLTTGSLFNSLTRESENNTNTSNSLAQQLLEQEDNNQEQSNNQNTLKK